MKGTDKFKVFKNVFDEGTMKNIFEVLNHERMIGLESPIKIGKEANVFSGLDKNNKRVAFKIYRVASCDFFRMRRYLEVDPRFKLRSSRKAIIEIWARREFANLTKAKRNKVNVPKPLYLFKNVLVMEFIGNTKKEEPSEAYPLLKDSIVKNPEKFFQELIENIKRLYRANLVHGDLSEFNILNKNQKPIIIDLSHGVPANSNIADELLKRDILTLIKYFNKKGLKIDEKKQEKIIKEIKSKRIKNNN